jgi:hypothetical protein
MPLPLQLRFEKSWGRSAESREDIGVYMGFGTGRCAGAFMMDCAGSAEEYCRPWVKRGLPSLSIYELR